MPTQLRRSRLRYLAAFAWIALTLTLAVWWMVFGLRQIEYLQALDTDAAFELVRHQRMLVGEGAFLVLLVVSGGIAILYYMAREKKHFEQVREFFATYTHDLKTSLASLRLQAESLQEDLAGSEHDRIISRLVKDTVRLELQLENSLYIANQNAELYVETLDLARILSSFRDYWPETQVELVGNCELQADSRALESVLKNLIQNAVQHGRAHSVRLKPAPADSNRVRLRLEDDGIGFSGDRGRLGQLFVRHNTTSGSGVGLYLARLLVAKMGGVFQFDSETAAGFAVEIILPGRVR